MYDEIWTAANGFYSSSRSSPTPGSPTSIPEDVCRAANLGYWTRRWSTRTPSRSTRRRWSSRGRVRCSSGCADLVGGRALPLNRIRRSIGAPGTPAPVVVGDRARVSKGAIEGKGGSILADDAALGPTAAIITIGDEIVEGRVLNENASWLSEELMARGVWPRLVVAVPDVSDLSCGCSASPAIGGPAVRLRRPRFHPRRHHPRRRCASVLPRRARRPRRGAAVPSGQRWADERIAAAAATFPIDAEPLEAADRRGSWFPAAPCLRAARGTG